jgi:serine/threonine protein phosphatase PrpC
MGHDLMSDMGATVPDLTVGVSSTQSDRWRVAAASVRGTSHEKTGTACQDSHSLLTVPENVLLAAISDGAGSASRSEIGSELAARTAIQELQRWCALSAPWPEADEEWSSIMRVAMAAARDAVEREAEIQGISSRDMAATLIVLLATPRVVVAGQIGDGAAVVADAENNLMALTTPQSGEYLNETTFLVSPHAVEQAQTTVWRGRATFLAAFSDGLQMLALRMSDGTPHAPFFTPLFRFLQNQQDMGEAGQQLHEFLTSPRITQRADDDLTLLLAYLPD